jgi:hypothetical protein
MTKIISKRDLLNEALGVPDGISEAAIMVYDKVMSAIPNNYGFDDLNDIKDKRIQINTDLEVSDYKFNNFSLQFNLIENDEDDELRIISFGSGNPMKMTRNGYESMSILKNFGVGFALRIVLSVPRYTTGGIIKQKLNSERESIIGVLAHEIMHTYNYYKNKKGNLPRELIYHLSTENNTGLRGVDNFFKCIYFGSLIESIVHASEIGTELKVRGIDRKNFLNFISSHDTIVNLKFVSQYTFDKFIIDLKSQIGYIKNSMQDANIPIPNNEDEIIFMFLKVYWKNLIDRGIEKIQDMIIDLNDINQLLYMSRFGRSMYEDAMKDVIRKVFLVRNEKNEESFKRFFEKEINYANFMAKKNLRKLFKLYAMAKNTDDKKLPSAMKRMTNESNKIFFQNSRFSPKTDLLKPNKNYGRNNDSFWKL